MACPLQLPGLIKNGRENEMPLGDLLIMSMLNAVAS